MNKNERMAMVMAKLKGTSFYKMPASTRYHNNFEGGLLDHSTGVWLNLERLTSALGLEWEDPSSPFVVAILHDACKIGMYFYNHDYGCWEHNPDHPIGHGDLSLKIIEELDIELTEEEMLCIRWHMGAFDEMENWNKFTDAIHKYPNVFWTHVADMMATHIDEVADTKPEPGVAACCICGASLGDSYGNNAAPVKDGQCCDHCNLTVVIPARLTSGGNTHEE